MPISVLVVDDDRAFRGLTKRLLTDLGLRVIGDVGTVADALTAAARLRPDAALVDIGLPDGDGLALADQLTALAWRPRVVLTSTDPNAATPARARRVGAVGFLPKDELAGDVLWRMLAGVG